jgi:hypothetical protein
MCNVNTARSAGFRAWIGAALPAIEVVCAIKPKIEEYRTTVLTLLFPATSIQGNIRA